MKEIVQRRRAMTSFETDMDHWVKKRESFSHRADQLKKQRMELLQATEVMTLGTNIPLYHVPLYHCATVPPIIVTIGY